MNIVEELIHEGHLIGNHESDLYCQDTPKAREIVKRHGYTFTEFTHQTDPEGPSPWLDVPFAYLPYWEAKARRTM